MPTPILPTGDFVVAYEFGNRTRRLKSDAVSLKVLSRKRGGQRYELTLAFEPMLPSEFGPITAFLEACQNSADNRFFVPIPPMTGVAGELVGNFVNFDNDTKLHRVTATGPTVVTPPARYAGGTIDSVNVYLRCSLVGEIQQFKHGNDGFVRFELDLEERT